MDRQELITKTDAVINETQSALLTMYDALNLGLQKKILKNEEVKALFDRYKVNY